MKFVPLPAARWRKLCSIGSGSRHAFKGNRRGDIPNTPKCMSMGAYNSRPSCPKQRAGIAPGSCCFAHLVRAASRAGTKTGQPQRRNPRPAQLYDGCVAKQCTTSRQSASDLEEPGPTVGKHGPLHLSALLCGEFRCCFWLRSGVVSEITDEAGRDG